MKGAAKSRKMKWLSKLFYFRSNHSLMFLKIGVLNNFANFTGKHLCWPLPGLKTYNFIKMRLHH